MSLDKVLDVGREGEDKDVPKPKEITDVEQELFNGKARIIRIEEGTLGMFINADNIKNKAYKESFSQRANRSAIRVWFELPDGGVYTMVFTKSTRPNSKLAAFRKKYGRAPYVGQEVEFKVNQNGYMEIDLD